MTAPWSHAVTVPTLPQPDIIIASAKARLVQLARERAVRDRPAAVDHSFGGSILPALCEIRDATISALESTGIPYRKGLRLALTAVGDREALAVSTEAQQADLARCAAVHPGVPSGRARSGQGRTSGSCRAPRAGDGAGRDRRPCGDDLRARCPQICPSTRRNCLRAGRQPGFVRDSGGG